MQRGRILAIKWGMNPNSSSLGVDVTFLLAGATAVGVGTASFADPRASLRIVREMEEWCTANDVRRVRDLIGGCK